MFDDCHVNSHGRKSGHRWESNPQPPRCKLGALSIELLAHKSGAEENQTLPSSLPGKIANLGSCDPKISCSNNQHLLLLPSLQVVRQEVRLYWIRSLISVNAEPCNFSGCGENQTRYKNFAKVPSYLSVRTQIYYLTAPVGLEPTIVLLQRQSPWAARARGKIKKQTARTGIEPVSLASETRVMPLYHRANWVVIVPT